MRRRERERRRGRKSRAEGQRREGRERNEGTRGERRSGERARPSEIRAQERAEAGGYVRVNVIKGRDRRGDERERDKRSDGWWWGSIGMRWRGRSAALAAVAEGKEGDKKRLRER